MNTIPEKQNSPRFIEYLAASSSIYGQAKFLAGLQMILTVPIPVLLSLFAIIFPGFRVWAAFYGIVISLSDMALIDLLQQAKKKEGAKVQELFDCELLEMPWRKFKVGEKPIHESIIKESHNFLQKAENRSKILDWYSPSVGQLPMHIARVVCQRSNITYDVELRRHYVKWLVFVGIGLGVAAPSIALLLNMAMEQIILSILVPIFPTISWLIREIQKQWKTNLKLDRMMSYAEKLLNEAIEKELTVSEIEAKSRELQDELFIHRYTNQPIFNWVYDRLKERLNFQMNTGVEALVEKVQGRLDAT